MTATVSSVCFCVLWNFRLPSSCFTAEFTASACGCRQAQVKRSDAAEEALRDLRQQHEHMSAQLFTTNQHNQSLTQHNEELSQWNQRLEQDNAALQADKAALEQRLQQQLVHQEDEVSRLLPLDA